MIYTLIKVVKVSKWLIAVAAVTGLGVAGYLHYKNNAQVSITPVRKVHPAENMGGKSVISMVHQNSIGNGISATGNVNGGQFEKY